MQICFPANSVAALSSIVMICGRVAFALVANGSHVATAPRACRCCNRAGISKTYTCQRYACAKLAMGVGASTSAGV